MPTCHVTMELHDGRLTAAFVDTKAGLPSSIHWYETQCGTRVVADKINRTLQHLQLFLNA